MIDFDSLTPSRELRGENDEDTALLRRMHDDALSFLRSKQWCQAIESSWFGTGVGGVVAVFLFRVVPAGHSDDWLWVVVGDLPTAYFVPDEAENPRAALELYIRLMEDWARAVRDQGDLDDVYPVDAPPDDEHADKLTGRMAFLREEVLPALGG